MRSDRRRQGSNNLIAPPRYPVFHLTDPNIIATRPYLDFCFLTHLLFQPHSFNMRGFTTLSRTAARSHLVGSSTQIPRRYASSAQSAPRRFLSTTIFLGGTVAFVAYYFDSRSLMHEHVVMPLVRLYDPETGHKVAVRVLGAPWWLRPKDRGTDGQDLKAEVCVSSRTRCKSSLPVDFRSAREQPGRHGSGI